MNLNAAKKVLHRNFIIVLNNLGTSEKNDYVKTDVLTLLIFSFGGVADSVAREELEVSGVGGLAWTDVGVLARMGI